MRAILPAIVLSALLVPLAAAAPPAADAYRAEVEKFRAERAQRLASEGGWLTVVGLTWLEPGENPFGCGKEATVALPDGVVKGTAGSFRLADGKVTLHVAPGAAVKRNDAAVTADAPLAVDASGKPDIVAVGRVTMYVIQRGDRFAIRMKDPESAMRKNFKGLEHYAIDPAMKVTGTFTPFDKPREVPVPSANGVTQVMYAPGRVAFTLKGKDLSLMPLLGAPEDKDLFFVFKDRTTGETTYGGGRFLDADPVDHGKVTLDFNKAYSPPCAFTPFATCPLPPRDNALDIAIEAGEKKPPGHP